MKLRSLGDANFDHDIVLGLWRRQPEIDFALPQDHIPERTEDPEVLAIAATMGAVLVTHDVRTMPFHFADFLQHSESPGLIVVPKLLPIASRSQPSRTGETNTVGCHSDLTPSDPTAK